MGILTPVESWDDVWEWDLVSDLEGGPGGALNTQAQQLLNRTEWLRAHVDQVESGEVTIKNRAVLFGCVVSANTSATRNLDITAGRVAIGGQLLRVPYAQATAAVAPNTTGTDVTLHA